MTKYEKFKLIIGTLFCSIFLLILYSYTSNYRNSSNGRYIYNKRGCILDTRTGTFYILRNKTYLRIDDYTEMEGEF